MGQAYLNKFTGHQFEEQSLWKLAVQAFHLNPLHNSFYALEPACILWQTLRQMTFSLARWPTITQAEKSQAITFLNNPKFQGHEWKQLCQGTICATVNIKVMQWITWWQPELHFPINNLFFILQLACPQG